MNTKFVCNLIIEQNKKMNELILLDYNVQDSLATQIKCSVGQNY